MKAYLVELLGSKSTNTYQKLAFVILFAKETFSPGSCHHVDGLDPYQRSNITTLIGSIIVERCIQRLDNTSIEDCNTQ